MVQFASRMDLLHGSEIRELLKLTAQPDIISFAGGLPAAELFPVEEMMAASKAVLEEHGREALQYSTTEGFPRLREQIAERMLAKNNIHTDADHILVTSGSQEGLDFSARVFLNPGRRCPAGEPVLPRCGQRFQGLRAALYRSAHRRRRHDDG